VVSKFVPPSPPTSLSLLEHNTTGSSVQEMIDLTTTTTKPKAKAKAVKTMKHFPGPETIGNAEYDELRLLIFSAVAHGKLHLKFEKKENKAAWQDFYQKSFTKDGACYGLFEPYTKRDSPEVKFRTNTYTGIKIDAERYEAKVASGEMPESLPDVERIAYKLHSERVKAQAAIDNEKAAVKEKLEKARSTKERAEVRLALRTTVTPSPVAGNPASLLGKLPSSGESSFLLSAY
jgi:hypothetical protein